MAIIPAPERPRRRRLQAFVSHDMYVPWANIEMAYVATPDDKLADGELGRWQAEFSQDESAAGREHGLETD